MDGNRPRHIDPTRPIPELYIFPERRFERMETSAKQISITANVPLERWYTAAMQVYDNCSYYMINNQVENAYMQAARIIYISKEGFPTHPQYSEYTSEARTKLEKVLPEVIRLEQRLRKEIMAVYNVQAAYYRYEEEQRQLRLADRKLWLANQEERTAKSAELFAAAEHHSHQLKMDIGRIMPLSIEPDFMHALNPKKAPEKETSPKPESSSTPPAAKRPFWEDPKSAPVKRAWDNPSTSPTPSTSKGPGGLKIPTSRRVSSASSASTSPYSSANRFPASRYIQKASALTRPHSSTPGRSAQEPVARRPDSSQQLTRVHSSPKPSSAGAANADVHSDPPSVENKSSPSNPNSDSGLPLRVCFEGVEIDLGVVHEARETWPEWPPASASVTRGYGIQSPPMVPGTSEMSAFRQVQKTTTSNDGASSSNS